MPEVPRIRRLMRVPLVRLPVIILTLVLAWPSSALSQAPSSPVPTSARREVRVGALGIPAALDPATALEGTLPLIAHQVFDTLVAYHEGTTDVEPALATRWSVSRDGLTWSFTLRDGVRFHDGTPLTSAEVVASFMRQLRPDASGTAVVWSALFQGTPGVVRDVRAPDPRTIDIGFPPGPPRRTEGALSLPGLRVGYLAFQTEKVPFSRKKVRQAVAAALDPVVIGVALEGAAVPLQSFLPPGVWARREGSPVLGGSRRAVKTLLAEGGWSEAFTPTLLVPSEVSPLNLPKVAEAIQVALGAQNIQLALRTEPLDAARAILQKGDHDLALLEAPVTAGDPHLLLFPLSTTEVASKGPRTLNFSFYRNPTLDGMLIRASQLTFRTERQRLYHRAQFLLAQELPWLPIYVRLTWAVARGDVHGLRLHPTGFSRLDTVTLEAEPGAAR